MLRHRTEEPPQLRDEKWAPGASIQGVVETGNRLSEARQADREGRHVRAERFRSVLRSVRSVFEVLLAMGGLAGFAVGLTLVATYKDTDFRRLILRRFLFIVFHLDLPDVIWIVAVAHGNRKPDYWSERSTDDPDALS